jgi:hypothetical protein
MLLDGILNQHKPGKVSHGSVFCCLTFFMKSLTWSEREVMKQEQERAEKYGKAMAFLHEQESASKSGQLGDDILPYSAAWLL